MHRCAGCQKQVPDRSERCGDCQLQHAKNEAALSLWAYNGIRELERWLVVKDAFELYVGWTDVWPSLPHLP